MVCAQQHARLTSSPCILDKPFFLSAQLKHRVLCTQKVVYPDTPPSRSRAYSSVLDDSMSWILRISPTLMLQVAQCFLRVAVGLGHVDAEVHKAVGVAPLVVVPGDELHEGLVQRNPGLDVHDRRELAADEVRAH